MAYLWIKALHVMAIITWMAALFYLPRLMVYHALVPAGPEGAERSAMLKVMERRLLKAIMTPSMIVAWLSGLWLAYDGGWFASPWLHVKLTAVVILSAIHGLLVGHVKAFAADRNTRPHVYFRVLNEVPTVLMIVIVLMVILKPW
ncbi:protoporphyrinogen oxidase HemJ [Segnochrobactraceae bacterium EtOH-i3]